MSESFPEHDFVAEDELKQIAKAVSEQLERKFLEDLAIFRANVYQLMHRHNALQTNGTGWAIFLPDQPNQELSGDSILINRKDVLVLVGNVKDTDNKIIRL